MAMVSLILPKIYLDTEQNTCICVVEHEAAFILLYSLLLEMWFCVLCTLTNCSIIILGITFDPLGREQARRFER